MLTAQRDSIRLLHGILVASVALPAALFIYASWLGYQNNQVIAERPSVKRCFTGTPVLTVSSMKKLVSVPKEALGCSLRAYPAMRGSLGRRKTRNRTDSGKPKKPGPAACGRKPKCKKRYRLAQHKRYVRRAVRRAHVSKKAIRRMKKIERCLYSSKARRKARRFRRAKLREKAQQDREQQINARRKR